MSFSVSSSPDSSNLANDRYYSVMQSESDSESLEDLKRRTSPPTVEKTFRHHTVANINSHSKINESIKDLEGFIDEILNGGQACTDKENSPQNIHLLYERIIYELKSEIKLLRDLTESTEMLLKDEIGYLRGELHEKNNIINTLALSSANENKFQTEGKAEVVSKAVVNKSHLKSDGNSNSHYVSDSMTATVAPPAVDQFSTEDDSLSKSSMKINNEVIADTVICNLYPRSLSMYKDVTIKNFSGSSTEEMFDYIKTSISRAPSEILVHVGMNDIAMGTDTMENIQKIVKLVKEATPKTKLTFSSIVIGKDFKDIIDHLNELNTKLKRYCKQNDFGFIDNSNLDESCLDFKTLHLNRKGDSLLSKNILSHLSKSQNSTPKKYSAQVPCIGYTL